MEVKRRRPYLIFNKTQCQTRPFKQCCYKNCPTTREDFEIEFPIKYFPVPKMKKRCKQWLELAGRQDLLNKPDFSHIEAHKSYQICFLHFKDRMFMHTEEDYPEKIGLLRLRVRVAQPVFDGSLMLRKVKAQIAAKSQPAKKIKKRVKGKKMIISLNPCQKLTVQATERINSSLSEPTVEQLEPGIVKSRFSFTDPTNEESVAIIEELLTASEQTLNSIVSNMCLEIEMNIRELYEDEEEMKESLQTNLEELMEEYENLFDERRKRGMVDSCKHKIIETIWSSMPFDINVRGSEQPSVSIKKEVDEGKNKDSSIRPLNEDLMDDTCIFIKADVDDIFTEKPDNGNSLKKVKLEPSDSVEPSMVIKQESQEFFNVSLAIEGKIKDSFPIRAPVEDLMDDTCIFIKAEVDDIFTEENGIPPLKKVKLEPSDSMSC